jgi:hypothetical protein
MEAQPTNQPLLPASDGMLPVSVIVPTYREVESLPELIRRVDEVRASGRMTLDLLIVDDDSGDGTEELIAGMKLNWVRLIVRKDVRGLSSAVLEGMRQARGEILVVMDGDLSHPPEKIPELVGAIAAGADFAVGSRYVPGGSTDAAWGPFRWMNSRVATWLARPLTSIKDPMSGFFAIRRDTLQRADGLDPIGYKIGLELLVRCGCRDVREIPIHFAERRFGRSKLSFAEQLRYVRHVGRLLRYKYLCASGPSVSTGAADKQGASPSAGTRFEGIRPAAARLLLVLTGCMMAYGIYIHGRTGTLIQKVPFDQSDYALYSRIVDRVRAGEGYYDAAGAELRSSGYPTRPFLTWRTPTVAEMMATLPRLEGIPFLLFFLGMGVVAAGCLFLWSGVVKGQADPWLRWICLAALGLQLWITTGVAPLEHEVWGGLLIALSLGLYARGFWKASVAAGVLAVFFRELALPLPVIMVALAMWHRRKGEAIAWLAGLAVFGVFLGYHAWMVNSHVTPADRAGPGWLHMGGWAFVLKTARANVLLLWARSWVAGFALPLVLLGLAGWRGPTGTRVFLVVAAYVISFLFVGRPVHPYWGLVYAPLLPLGAIFAPKALRDLVRAAGWRRMPTPNPAQDKAQQLV